VYNQGCYNILGIIELCLQFNKYYSRFKQKS